MMHSTAFFKPLQNKKVHVDENSLAQQGMSNEVTK